MDRHWMSSEQRELDAKKQSNASQAYNEATTASRNVKHTPDGSVLGFGTRGLSIGDASTKMLIQNSSNFRLYERSLSGERDDSRQRVQSTFLPKDQSVQLLEVTFQVPDPATARKGSLETSRINAHKRFSQVPPTFTKLNQQATERSKVRAIHQLEYIDPKSQGQN